MRESEWRADVEAASDADRYRREGDRLTGLETKSRAEGAGLDDPQIARISSMLKSYNEMRKGEEFVRREVRSRARERARWIIGTLMLLVALPLVPMPLLHSAALSVPSGASPVLTAAAGYAACIAWLVD